MRRARNRILIGQPLYSARDEQLLEEHLAAIAEIVGERATSFPAMEYVLDRLAMRLGEKVPHVRHLNLLRFIGAAAAGNVMAEFRLVARRKDPNWFEIAEDMRISPNDARSMAERPDLL
jgi:hypothetical protein